MVRTRKDVLGEFSGGTGDEHESDLRKHWHPFYQEPQLVYVLSRQLGCQRPLQVGNDDADTCIWLFEFFRNANSSIFGTTICTIFFDKRGVLTKTTSLIALSANDYRTSQVQIPNLAGAP